jgi:hypothetical protein
LRRGDVLALARLENVDISSSSSNLISILDVLVLYLSVDLVVWVISNDRDVFCPITIVVMGVEPRLSLSRIRRGH